MFPVYVDTNIFKPKFVKMAKANTSITAITQPSETSGLRERSNLKESAAHKEKTIKYSDKSAGQPELAEIFNIIKKLMKLYIKGAVKERGEKEGIYNLVSEKQIETAGKKADEIYFASLIVQKGFVGFYFMPVYATDTIKQQLGPNLLKSLKGKSCFHIKKNNPVVTVQIKEALETGYQLYEAKGWV